MDYLSLAQSRYTSKAYEPEKSIPAQALHQFLEILRLTPSSINIQPWKFIVAQSDDAKHNITTAMPGSFSYNVAKITNSTATIIFTAKQHLDTQHLDNILNAEQQAGRLATAEIVAQQKSLRAGYIELYQSTGKIDTWIDNQIHIALGNAIYAAAALGFDASPIGGFDSVILDNALQLPQQGLRSVVLLSLGYRSTNDFNANLAKARLAPEQLIQFI